MATLLLLASPADGPALADIYRPAVTDSVAWFERPLAPRGPDPPAPRPLPGCREEPAFRAALDAGRPHLV